jgi:hypothetical protein
MKPFRETLTKIESKIMPVNHIDHRFRLENLSFTMVGISLQASMLTSNNLNYSIQCNYSHKDKAITDWIMMDNYGAEFQVVGIVSKTLYFFARRSAVSLIESLGYEVHDD